MPKASEISKLSPARQRAYRAIWKLYSEKHYSPSLEEISAEGRLQVGNLHIIVLWLEKNGWITRAENTRRSIVPQVKLSRRELSLA